MKPPAGIIMARSLLKIVERAAKDAYPEESCGLLVGRLDTDGRIVITEVFPSANVAEGDRRIAFEVDPAIRFAVMRRTEGTNEMIVGHYHSHPDHAPEPSARDLAMVFEPEFIWLITESTADRARGSQAFIAAADGTGFAPIPILDHPPM